MSACPTITQRIRADVYSMLLASPYRDYITRYDRCDVVCFSNEITRYACMYLRKTHTDIRLFVNDRTIVGYLANSATVLSPVAEDSGESKLS